MEQHIKQRLLGTVVLVSIAVIVLPLLLDGEGYRAMQKIEIDAPQKPKFEYHQEGFTTPLNEPNKQADLLDPPPPIDIKGFNDDLTEPPSPPIDIKGLNDDLTEQPSPPKQIDASSQNHTSPEALSDEPMDAELTTLWVMQVGSFSVESNALAARKKINAMEAKNVFTEINTEMVNDREVYVVKVISDDYEALSKIAELIKKDYPDAFIKERE